MLSLPLKALLRSSPGLFFASLLVFACTPTADKPPPPAASASAAASASGKAAGSASPDDAQQGGGDDEIRPAYPPQVASNPLAQRFCEGLHEMPAKRRAECCSSAEAGFTITSECTRTLSFALQEKSVTLDAADVDRCVEALNKAHEGCGWVGPNPQFLPASCRSIIKGAVPNGGVCRSSLDCAAGVHCHGAGPTNLGKCGPPRPSKSACELSIDTLAVYTRQEEAEWQHPECTGYCTRHKCFDAVPVGGECQVSPECGANRTCANGKCSDAPLPAAGQPCPGGACAGDGRCLKGTCMTPKPEGEACTIDAECRGGCVRKDKAAKGKCDKSCGP